MASGLIALLDDVAALAKAAAASLDDAAAQASKATSKAAGIVIDDAAVTPRYVVGFTADRELPVIWKIALGSLRNKFFWLLPGALLLSLVAPWIITPLLMAGGAYLCLEGYHKVRDLIRPSAKDHGHGHGEPASHPPHPAVPQTGPEAEAAKVASAIRTDFILSAEIMAITLSSVEASPLWLRAVVLGIVGLGMTAMVYGAVALIVKADDLGGHLALSGRPPLDSFGRGLVTAMPAFLKILSLVGMVAMLWVGGGILVHGLHELGFHGPEAFVHRVSHGLHPFLHWLVTAGIYAVIGLAAGALCDPLAHAAQRLAKRG